MNLRLPFSRTVAYSFLFVGLLFLLGIALSRFGSDIRWIAAPPNTNYNPLPRVATRTKTIERMVPQVVTREVIVYRTVNAKQAAKIEKRYGLTDGELNKVTTNPDTGATTPTTQILTEVETGKLEYGGSALVTLDPQGNTTVTIAPNRAPWFEFGGDFEVGGGVVYRTGDDFGQGYTLHAGKDLFRIGRLTTTVRADVDLFTSGQTDTRITALGVIRF